MQLKRKFRLKIRYTLCETSSVFYFLRAFVRDEVFKLVENY